MSTTHWQCGHCSKPKQSEAGMCGNCFKFPTKNCPTKEDTMTLDLDHVREVMLANVRVGDRVTILVPSGQHIDRDSGKIVQEWAERTGKAIICARPWEGPQTRVTLNLGGKYGTPGVATVDNIVRVNSKGDARR